MVLETAVVEGQEGDLGDLLVCFGDLAPPVQAQLGLEDALALQEELSYHIVRLRQHAEAARVRTAAVTAAVSWDTETPVCLGDCDPWVTASDSHRAARLGEVTRLEVAVIGGTATDEERLAYLALREPFDMEEATRFRYRTESDVAPQLDFDLDYGTNEIGPDDDITTARLAEPMPAYDLTIATRVDHWGRAIHEPVKAGEFVYDSLLWSEIPKAAAELEARGEHKIASVLLGWMDVNQESVGGVG